MKLQTQIQLLKNQNRIDYSCGVLLLGSCFSENIGNRFTYFQFQATQNPFGILFHPLAIENLLERAVKGRDYDTSEVFELQEKWLSFDAHSVMGRNSQEDLIDSLNKALFRTNTQLEKASHVIITLGTAWVYRRLENDVVVANCHKVPQNQFEKQLLTVEEITGALKRMVQLIQSVSKNTQCIFTISPVRHLKDGFVENQRSKAHLIAAVHQLQMENVSYFPSYEIMMDELRDYRFYERDMVHPNEVAIDIIWNRFRESWISEDAYVTMDEVDAVQKGLSHRPFNPKSEANQDFQKSLSNKISYLQDRYPFMKFD
nr:GSCFA domain-containing protein [Allomuricauda sp.]